MKKITSIFILVAVLLSCFSKLGIVVYYQWNKKYISEVLCVNKNNPEKHCEGKCHLKKQLQKDEERQKNIPSGVKEVEEIVLFNPSTELHFNVFPTNQRVNFSFYQIGNYSSPLFSFFHPPKVVC